MSERRPRDRTGDEAYVLHTYPYRETSLLVDVYARGAGRVTLVARGARRPRSPMRGVLLSFQPVQLGWYGKGEVRTLTRAEWIGGQPLLQGEALLCGFYLNELLLRLLPREDPHDALFERYGETVRAAARADLKLAGQTLLDIARDDFSDAVTQQQAKLLMRSLINHRLEYQPLRSRRIF